ncbi:DUF4926 domain-containing protein [Roseofilum sp. Guam]|nr:DUF4926 domain-containing protein [Roseofilum sp. Guam]MBP0029831.1 DUF4926 domain-containing protein [Roseofilum sp. Guam]
MFQELDVVTLNHDFEEHGLKKNSKGTIVHCYADEQAFEVEFLSESGETLALLTLAKSDIELEREAIGAEVLAIIHGLPVDLLAQIRDYAEFLRYKSTKQIR